MKVHIYEKKNRSARERLDHCLRCKFYGNIVSLSKKSIVLGERTLQAVSKLSYPTTMITLSTF